MVILQEAAQSLFAAHAALTAADAFLIGRKRQNVSFAQMVPLLKAPPDIHCPGCHRFVRFRPAVPLYPVRNILCINVLDFMRRLEVIFSACLAWFTIDHAEIIGYNLRMECVE
jgi:hypothetical protein